MIECEMKAWVDNYDEVKSYCQSFFEFVEEFDKKDEYFKSKDGKYIRIRNEGDVDYLVTHKEKHISKGFEANQEINFRILDKEEFINWLHTMEYYSDYKKEKEGLRFKKDDIIIELFSIQGLGFFIEIEKIVKESETFQARGEIEHILRDMQLFYRIEEKPYAQLLEENLIR